MENRESKVTTLGSITVSVGKPNKEGRRNNGVEFTVKHVAGEDISEYEKRYAYFKDKAMREI